MVSSDDLAETQPLLDLSVHGVPASFATRLEKPWKENLSLALPAAASSTLAPRGILVHFRVAGKQTGPQAVDVDNLCEPLFSVLVNQKQWFGGRRQNIQWYQVSKSYEEETGCDMAVVPSGPPELPQANLLLSSIYRGPLPAHAKDPSFAQWVTQNADLSRRGERYGVVLQFGSASINIGDIATGAVKHLIDGLYPILGGPPGAPEDWRVTILRVHKDVAEIPEGGVGVMVYPLL